MKEFNNREIANKHAEYITGKELRKYVAEKVKKYVGDSPTIFDGAVGSGQLEQYINPSFIHGVEIQQLACEAFLENYGNAEVENLSFFNYESDLQADCTVMNYPFSLKFKELTVEEQENIKKDFPWKKSGVVDDIFILKSLKYTKRYGFYIGFPGITYRKTEQKFRDVIGNSLLELNVITNAFEDTAIDVIFLVIDKKKTTDDVNKEIYDCKSKKIMHSEMCNSFDDRWAQPRMEVIEEEIDIVALEKEIQETKMRRRKIEDELDKFIKETFHSEVERGQG